MTTAAIELRGLTKLFGGLRANDGVDVRVEKGTIHAIVGENGAGKSTAMKMVYGIYRPDAGEILVNSQSRKWNSPRDAIAAGIGMVHQHFMLAEPETALENVLLEGEPNISGLRKWVPMPLRPLRRGSARARLQELSRKYGLEVSWDRPVRELPVGVQQRVEILKLLYHDARILILDEPTAVLTPQETEQLFSHLKALAREGRTILIITHKLQEVMSLADRVTVFRAGRVAGNREIGETSPEDLATLMVGRKVNLRIAPPPEKEPGSPLLELRGVSVANRLKRLDFSVRAGEVVGIAGVEGNGQSDLLQLLIHPRDHASSCSGEVKYFGEDALHWGAARVRESGVGIIPEDRLREGLLAGRSLTENFLLGLQNRAPFRTRGGIVARAALKERTLAAIREFDVRPARPEALAGGLSGGNQQKLIIAREMEAKPRFLIAAQPSRGVDVGAIELIHGRILQARNAGMGVLLVSSELEEVMALSDRILVMYEGAVAAEFKRGEADERRLGLYMGGGRE